uniref:Zf-CCHC domain-containing protein/DUF4219 domain-containing protein/UBN2 domain-containing protein n=1 Tax=Tanacetum cinerariifolium TaxID=118510 RepID=A0A6L2JAZ5_TANCI|nr:zf-CCHC domain-containing protein/DUF4219 domain-containing protein/UBN2 domain-containing protein [Tanacetum cinerariifolium]
MKLAVEQHCAEKTKFQTKMENVLKENDRLLTYALSVEIVNIVVHDCMNVNCLNVDACVHGVTTESELKPDFIKKECYETDIVSSPESAPTFAELFEINNLKAQVQEKDIVILKLKEKLKSISGDVKERKANCFIYWKNRFETYVKSKDIDLWYIIAYGDYKPTIKVKDARKVLSEEEEATSSDSNDEEYAMGVRDFKKFVKRKGKFVRQTHDDKRNFRKAKEDKKEKVDQRCFKCGDPHHFISDCPKHSFNDQKAFIVGCWSDSEDDSKKEEICLIDSSDNKVVCLGGSHRQKGGVRLETAARGGRGAGFLLTARGVCFVGQHPQTGCVWFVWGNSRFRAAWIKSSVRCCLD